MGERSVIRLTSELSLPAYVRRAVQPRILRGLIHGQGRRYRKIAWERLRKVGGFRSHLQAESWRSRYEVSRNFLEPLSILTQRKTPLLFIFGSDDDLLEEFDRAFPSTPAWDSGRMKTSPWLSCPERSMGSSRWQFKTRSSNACRRGSILRS